MTCIRSTSAAASQVVSCPRAIARAVVATGLALGAVFVTTSDVAAQVVQIANHRPSAFVGWKRTTVDTRPPFGAGHVGDVAYVRGRQVGLDTWIVDLHLSLAAEEVRTVDLAAAMATTPPAVGLPADALAFFGGPLMAGGTVLAIDDVRADGAAVIVHGHGRPLPYLNVDVWLQWYPDQPGLVTGEAIATASNGALPDVGIELPDTGLSLQWGDGMVNVIGAGWNAPLVPSRTRFADGQARAVPFVVMWPRLLQDEQQWRQVAAAVEQSVCATGIERLWPHGTPTYPSSFDVVAWTQANFDEARRRLHTWLGGVIGPSPNSCVTGAQWDQVFVGGEYALPGGTGAEVVTYLSALKLAARPCHHLEANGRQADPQDHPDCVFWSGRPHWHPLVSPDQLGKTQSIGIEDTHGWWGPDREHWLYNTVAAAARLTGSPALQWELEQQARLFLFGETTQPGLSTTSPDAARSIGWAGILVAHLWRNLENRALAERVATRWRDRVAQVYVPFLAGKPQHIWDVRVDDERVGRGPMWMAWQQSIGSYGLDLACELLDIPAGRQLAFDGAMACVQHNWILQGGRYHGVGNIRFPPPPPSYYASMFWPDPWFETTWDLPALAVVLQQTPGDVKATSIWRQATGDLGQQPRSWVPPGMSLR